MTRKQQTKALKDMSANTAAITGTETLNDPVNAATGKAYKNGNRETLLQAAASQGFTSNEWATMKQWNNIHHQIAKREKGTAITFNILEHKDGELIEVSQTAYLFNRCQLADTKQPVKATA